MTEEMVKGKVVRKEGKYFLDLAGKTEEIPLGIMANAGDLKELVGKEVEVFYATPRSYVVAIGRKKLKKPPILCNIPVFLELVEPIATNLTREWSNTIADQLVQRGAITEKLAKEIKNY